MWCGDCYAKHPKDDFPKYVKELVGDWEGDLEGRYEKGGVIDTMLIHFQCDLCHFRDMKGRYPNEGSDIDKILIIYIRRASMDVFWIR